MVPLARLDDDVLGAGTWELGVVDTSDQDGPVVAPPALTVAPPRLLRAREPYRERTQPITASSIARMMSAVLIIGPADDGTTSGST